MITAYIFLWAMSVMIAFGMGYIYAYQFYKSKYAELHKTLLNTIERVNVLTNLIRSKFPEIDADLDENKPGEI